MAGVSWGLVAAFAATGVLMALLSCLVGMRPRLENPLWWALYAVWVAIVLSAGIEAPFLTLWLSSILAGLLHGGVTALLLDRYIANNPWHADRTKGPRGKLAAQFVAMGVVIGAVFGLVVAGIAWGLARI